MHVLVTGGAGFIGSAIVDQLLESGHSVRVIDWLLPAAHHSKPDYLNDSAEYRWLDLRDSRSAADALIDIDAVCHQASMVGLGVDFADVVDYVSHNDLGSAVLLRAMHDQRFMGRTVLASSMVVYGEGRYRCRLHELVRPRPRDPARLAAGDYEARCPHCDAPIEPEPIPEDAPTDPRNVYAATKLHQEHLLAAFAREHNSSWIALRYHNVYGPRMPINTPYAGVASIFRSAVERGEVPSVFEDGGQLRDFIHVRDVARANVLALTAPSEPDLDGAYNVATGHPHTIHDLASAITDAVPDGAQMTPLIVGGHRVGDVRHVIASPERARTELGFFAETTFEEGLAEFSQSEIRA